MTFCSNCGKPVEGSGRFCVHCGAEVVPASESAAHAASAMPAGVSAAMPAAVPPVNNVQSFQPVQYAPSGAVPIAVGIPGPVPATPQQKRGGMAGTLVVLAVIAAGGYYYYDHAKTAAPPSAPATTPPSTPATAPPPTPGATQNKALVQQQSFNAQWQDESGMLVLTSAKWTNSANVTLSSAVVQCEQYNAVGTDLSQYRVTLNGPTQPNAASTYSNIQIGAIASGMSKVNCDIVHVKPAQ